MSDDVHFTREQINAAIAKRLESLDVADMAKRQREEVDFASSLLVTIVYISQVATPLLLLIIIAILLNR